MPRRGFWIWLVFCCLPLPFWGGVKALRVLFSESLAPTPGTFEFWLAIQSDLVLECPTADALGPSTYFSGCGDGPKPPSEAVSFPIPQGAEQGAVGRLEAFLTSKGLGPTGPWDAGERWFEGRGRSVEVRIYEGGPGVRICELTEWMRVDR